MRVLVLNSGSSSIKYQLFDMPRTEVISKGLIELIGKDGQTKDHYTSLKTVLAGIHDIKVVGHRVVHGGEKFKKPVIVDEQVIKKIRQCSAIAPLHNPANLAGIIACKKLMPGIKQVAVFDTAFHQTLPEYAYMYALPYEYYKKFGIRKYGFHGTSHEYVARQAARLLKRPFNRVKIITCHLGNGCSITAIRHGKSIDTSMGFTPLEGLIMGTRCGDIDPALITYIMHKKRLSTVQIDEIINKKSGLKGISGISSDMRALNEKAKNSHSRAALAITMFTYRIKKYVGAYIAAMGGCDAIVFTGGIGENQPDIKEAVAGSILPNLKRKPKILVIATNEELMIAQQAFRVVGGR